MKYLALIVIVISVSFLETLAIKPTLSVWINGSPFSYQDVVKARVTYDDADGDPLGNYIYTWHRATSNTGANATIFFGGADKVRISSDEVGNYIAVSVIAIQANGLEQSDETWSIWYYVENTPPQTTPDSYTGLIEGAVNSPVLSVLVNDSDFENHDITAFLLAQPAHGSINMATDGTFTYTHNGTPTTTDGFTYRAYDSYDYSNETSVSLNITMVNDAPVGVADSYSGVNEGGVLIINAPGILANDTDADNDPLEARLRSIAQHGTVVLNSDGGFTYTHDGSENHSDSFAYRAFDDSDSSALINVGITITAVNNAPVFVSSPVTSASEGIPYIYNIGLSDAENDFLTLETNTKPDWLTLQEIDNTHFTLSGTPAPDDTGNSPVLLTLTDGIIATPVSQNFVVEVSFLNNPPVITTTPATSANEDALYEYLVKAQDSDHPTLTFRAEFDVDWLEFDPSVSATSARLYGTPLQADVGQSTPVSIFVSDGIEEVEQSYFINVLNVNDPPVFTSVPVILSQEDVLYTYLITAVDEDGDNMVIQATEKPDFLTFETISNGSARLIGTPNNSDVGDHTVELAVTDNMSAPVPQVFELTVEPVNDRPIANTDNYQVDEGGLLNVSALNGVLQNDFDAENDPLRAFIVSGPVYSSAFSFNPDGSFSYKHNGQHIGSDKFTYKATDGIDTSLVATVNISVNLLNDPPVARDDSYTSSEGAVLTVTQAEGVLANDTDEETLTGLAVKSILTSPQYGILTINFATGAFVYSHDGSETTMDYFEYILEDAGGATDTARVTITILPVNDAPVLSTPGTEPMEYTEGTAAKLISPSILINDVDDEQLVSAHIQFTNNYINTEDSLLLNGNFTGITVNFDQPSGTLNLTGSAQITAYQSALQNIRYINTNNLNPSNLDRTLTFSVSDGKSTSNTVSRLVKIIAVNDPPIVNSLVISSNGRISDTVRSSYQYTDPEGDAEGKGIFQWYQSGNALGNGKTLIELADTSFYKPVFSNGGKYVQLEYTPVDVRNARGNRVESNYLYINAAPEVKSLTVTGIRAVNELLSATFTYSDIEGDLAGIHSYQWYKSDTGSAFLPTPIIGANSPAYTVKNTDKDKLLAVEVTPASISGSPTGKTVLSGWTFISLLPSVSISDSVTVCNDSLAYLSITQTGKYPVSFTYSINEIVQADTVVIENDEEVSLEASDTGTYRIVKVWDAVFPKGTQSGTAHVSHYSDPSIELSGSLSICANDTTTYYLPLQVAGGLSPYTFDYLIDGQHAGSKSNVRAIDSIAVKISQSGVYTVGKIIDSRGCYSNGSGQSAVIEKLTPRAVISGIDTLCEGDSARINVHRISGSGSWKFSYLWQDELKEVEVIDPQADEYTLYEKRDGNYSLQTIETSDNGLGCVSGQAAISKHAQPVAFISGDYQICAGSDTLLHVGLSGTAPWTFTYAVNGVTKDTVRNVTTSVYPLRVKDEGKYTLRRLSDAYCPGRTSDTAYIDTIALPDVKILNVNHVYTIRDQEVILDGYPAGGVFNGNGAFVFKSFEGDWFFYPQHTSPTIDIPYNLTYRYSKPESGCSSADTAQIFVVSDFGNIFILNADDTICVTSDTIILRGVNSDPNRQHGQFRIEGDKGLINFNNDSALIIPSEIIDKPGFYKRRVYYSFDLGGTEETVFKDIYFQKLQADFSWFNDCFNDSSRVKFIDQSIGSESFSDYTWRFHLPDSTFEVTDTNQLYFTFHHNSTYPIEHIVKTELGCADTIQKSLKLEQALLIDNEPYAEDFENGSAGWKFGSLNHEQPIWKMGSPQGNTIKVPASGGKAWYTQIDDHSREYQSYLVSPCFSFEKQQLPFVKFKMWRAFEMNEIIANDGAVLQYTTDGENWQNVGAIDDGVEWYNWYDIISQPAGQSVGWYKTRDIKWVEARHSLDFLAGKRFVRFRFVYASQGEEISNEGMAIDDFSIGTRSKTILFEHFTHVNDTHSMNANARLNAIANEFRHDIVDIQYHTSLLGYDPFYNNNPIAINSRESYYGINKVPYTLVDGGRNNKPSMIYDHIDREMTRNDIIKSFLVDNSFDINVSLSESGGNLNIDTELSARRDMTKRLVSLYIVITERSITDYTSINDEDEFEGVFVTMLPSPEGTSFNMKWDRGQKEQVSFDWKIQRVRNKEEVRVVAFIQDASTKEVYQATYTDLVPLVGNDEVVLEGTQKPMFILTPNPVIDKAFVRFSKDLENSGILKLYASTGQLIELIPVHAIETLDINLSQYRSGIYFIQFISSENQSQTQKFIIE